MSLLLNGYKKIAKLTEREVKYTYQHLKGKINSGKGQDNELFEKGYMRM